MTWVRLLSAVAAGAILSQWAVGREISGEHAVKSVETFLKSTAEPQRVSYPRLRADHVTFTGKVIAFEARASVDDYFNYAFIRAQKDFYCLKLEPVENHNASDYVSAYAPRKLWKGIIDKLVSAEEKEKGKIHVEAAVMVVEETDGWQCALLVDLRLPDAAGDKRDDWILRTVVTNAATEAAAEARQTAIQRAAAEQERITAEQERDNAKWRTWTDSTGKYKTEAKFGGVISGTVTLIKRDGSKVQLPLEKLCDEDRQWMAKRKK